jgi:hypothetical protein
MDRKTVFVIGAGASTEVNLPTGDNLKKIIAKLLDIRFPDGYNQNSGDLAITEAFRILAREENSQKVDINPYLNEAWHIRDNMPNAISIDNFIDQQRNNEKIALCGKLAIVKSILDAESKSNLYFEPYQGNKTINYINLENTWYTNFFKLITENCTKDELKPRFESITLIIFNYDRCVEHYLFHTLQKHYKINETLAAELVKCIHIYHPYGSVGFLPWWQPNDSMPFGQTPNAQQLLALTKKINTFTEGTDPNSSDIKDIKGHMAKASHLVFLGFAFHKLNMKLIEPAANTTDGFNVVRCYATAFEVSEDNREAIREKITHLYASRRDVGVKISDKKCGKFLSDFWLSLSF